MFNLRNLFSIDRFQGRCRGTWEQLQSSSRFFRKNLEDDNILVNLSVYDACTNDFFTLSQQLVWIWDISRSYAKFAALFKSFQIIGCASDANIYFHSMLLKDRFAAGETDFIIIWVKKPKVNTFKSSLERSILSKFMSVS